MRLGVGMSHCGRGLTVISDCYAAHRGGGSHDQAVKTPGPNGSKLRGRFGGGVLACGKIGIGGIREQIYGLVTGESIPLCNCPSRYTATRQNRWSPTVGGLSGLPIGRLNTYSPMLKARITKQHGGSPCGVPFTTNLKGSIPKFQKGLQRQDPFKLLDLRQEGIRSSHLGS